MGLLHLTRSYVPDRFPPDSQEVFMPAPRKRVPRTSDPRPGQGKPQRARKPQAKKAAPSSRKTSPLGAARRAATRSLSSTQKARPMSRQISSGIARPSIVRSSKLSSKTGTRTTDRSFSETGYKAPSARAKKTWAYKKARRAKR